MPRFSSNDMVHNHYLEEAKKKTQESGRNSRPGVMPSARSQSTANEVNSRAKVPSNQTTSKNKPIEQISVAKKPERQIPKGHRFSIKKTTVVHEKTMTPRFCLRRKPTGKIFKTVGFRWIPTGKIFDSSTTKVDNTLSLSAGKTQSLVAKKTDTSETRALRNFASKQVLDLLFGPLYDEFFNAGTSTVNISSSPTDNSKQQDTPPSATAQSTTELITLTTTITAEDNMKIFLKKKKKRKI
ncbi:hypothetical protein Tco_1547800 [Tanacetum coccineum]